jgi:hypothetical protein
MEPLYVFGTMTTVVLGLIAYVVKRNDNKLDAIEMTLIEHGRSIASIQAKLDILLKD